MRVIAGDLRGRTLRTPPGRQLRPTQGHVRQVLFDIVGESIVGERVLDLFAGVGAIGIEALSRGAREVTFVERDPTALRYLRANLQILGLDDRSRVLPVAVEASPKILAAMGPPFPWIFADPPYRVDSNAWISRVTQGGPGAILDRAGTLVVESSGRSLPAERLGGLKRLRDHAVGETHLGFYGWDGGTDGEEDRDISRDV